MLNDAELKDINGGAFSFALIGTIAAFISFIIGAIDGYIRPLKCR